MKVLFVTATRLGDAVLSMGLLDHVVRTWPEARLTIACGPLPAPLFEAVPGLEALVVLRKRSYHRHWLELWTRVRKTRWDLVIDLRDSVVSRLIPAGKRFIKSASTTPGRHKVEQNAAIMNLKEAPAPRLWLTNAARARARQILADAGPVLGIGPTANWAAKIWPPECFIAMVRELIKPDGLMPRARVAVFAAENEDHLARPVADAIPTELLVDLIGKTDVALAAALLERCSLYVGNDSGLMHLAAAAGTPTVGLFGPGRPDLYHPWGRHAIYVSAPEPGALLAGGRGFDPRNTPCLMTALTVGAVLEELQRFWPVVRREVMGDAA